VYTMVNAAVGGSAAQATADLRQCRVCSCCGYRAAEKPSSYHVCLIYVSTLLHVVFLPCILILLYIAPRGTAGRLFHHYTAACLYLALGCSTDKIHHACALHGGHWQQQRTRWGSFAVPTAK
jgi:hypothetical protein